MHLRQPDHRDGHPPSPHGLARQLRGDLPRRWAERDGTYDAVYAAMNPA